LGLGAVKGDRLHVRLVAAQGLEDGASRAAPQHHTVVTRAASQKPFAIKVKALDRLRVAAVQGFCHVSSSCIPEFYRGVV